MVLDVTVGMRSDASVVNPDSFGKGYVVPGNLAMCDTEEKKRLYWKHNYYKHKKGYKESDPIAERAERLTREAIAKREAEQVNNNKNN